jgi:rhomboid protease GluP
MFGFKMYKETPVTWILFWLNILVMSFTFYFSKSLTPSPQVLSYMGALKFHDYSLHLLSYMFLHAGMVHVLMNMMALLMCGKKVEKLIGSSAFFVTYMMSGLVGGLFATTFSSSHGMTVGASGAILGIIACEFALHLKYKTYKSKAGKTNLKTLVFDIFLIMLISALPFVSGAAHFGGFLAGFVITYFTHVVSPQENLEQWSREFDMDKVGSNLK